MKKEWKRAEFEELNIQSTAQAPTQKTEFDLLVDGEFIQGKSSGSAIPIEYYPE